MSFSWCKIKLIPPQICLRILKRIIQLNEGWSNSHSTLSVLYLFFFFFSSILFSSITLITYSYHSSSLSLLYVSFFLPLLFSVYCFLMYMYMNYSYTPMWVCGHMLVSLSTCVHTCVERPEVNSRCLPYLFPFTLFRLSLSLTLVLRDSIRASCHWVHEIHLFWLLNWDNKCTLLYPTFYVNVWDLNSGLHAFSAISLWIN